MALSFEYMKPFPDILILDESIEEKGESHEERVK